VSYRIADKGSEPSLIPATSEYLPELERVRTARKEALQTAKDDSMARLMKDLAVDRERNPEAASSDRWEDDGDDDDDDDDGGDVDIIDRSGSSALPHLPLAMQS
jgi:hypothetical protein